MPDLLSAHFLHNLYDHNRQIATVLQFLQAVHDPFCNCSCLFHDPVCIAFLPPSNIPSGLLDALHLIRHFCINTASYKIVTDHLHDNRNDP